jgi:transposase-like protein
MSERKHTRYSKEFKLEAIRRVNQIYKWKKQLKLKQDGAFPGKGGAADKDAEIRRLKKELTATHEENEFLK